MGTMVITGATGSVGQELLDRFHRDYQVVAQGRDAQELLKLRARYPGLEVVLGDLRSSRLYEAIRGAEIVIHAAAQKYVDLAERHCAYTLDTNVLCTYELAKAACAASVGKFIFISTDKSSAPGNVYGMSKFLAERLLLELADLHTETTIGICRFGNVFGSQGSVIRLWMDAQRRGERTIRVTDPEMTRFMFTLEEAGDLVSFALRQAASGDIMIPKMRGVCLRDLTALFPQAQIEVVGPRPGEKQHETLYVRGETSTGYETERYFILNKKSPSLLPLDTIDSANVDRVGPAELQHWLGGVQRLAA